MVNCLFERSEVPISGICKRNNIDCDKTQIPIMTRQHKSITFTKPLNKEVIYYLIRKEHNAWQFRNVSLLLAYSLGQGEKMAFIILHELILLFFILFKHLNACIAIEHSHH